MFKDPGYTKTVSMGLSHVLSDIGLNDRIVMKRRTHSQLNESIDKQGLQCVTLLQNVVCLHYIFGSKSEGTTTPGLNSDIDLFYSFDVVNIIQDLSEFKPGVGNYLMIQDQTVPPGYCLLQLLREGVPVPVPETQVPSEHHFKDMLGRILIKNTTIEAIAHTSSARAVAANAKAVRHGPTHSAPRPSRFGVVDKVIGRQCKSWPIQAEQWLGEGRWPSESMKRDCSKTGCFVVGVGFKGSKNHELEWRISTSLAERRLMFSLNNTQIRCYVLMKMLLKDYIKPYFEDTISSFMCKNVLFHTIANTKSNFWRESNLIVCLSRCLVVLYNYVLNKNCPHFIIPKNNLMAGHFTQETKNLLLKILELIIKNIFKALLEVDCDDLCVRLKFFNERLLNSINSYISGSLSLSSAINLNETAMVRLLHLSNCSNERALQLLLEYIFNLNSIKHEDHKQNQKAYMYLTSRFYSTLGSFLASISIGQGNSISDIAHKWISMGLKTDELSSKLKQASMFHCKEDIQETENKLRDIEENYDINIVEPACGCFPFEKQCLRRGFLAISDINEEPLLNISACCVAYLQCEINCVPRELRFEMFRSTKDDLPLRDPFDNWMDLAVVDSLPYLYFLQYKTYRHLGRQDDKQRYLSNLLKTIKEEPNLGHRETALNLLGQCMEEEDRVNDAFNCYVVSLGLRKRDNAAKIHICRLLSKLIIPRKCLHAVVMEM